jgi:DNA-binding PadR family transcriptional regulator
MVVRNGLLVLLDSGSKYGYQLKTELERSVHHVWSLNIGQIYTTLARLERDGFVESVDGEGSGSQRLYRITDLGRQEVRRWFETPVDRTIPRRNELTMKVVLALRSGQDPLQVIQVQRAAAVAALQEYTRLKTDGSADLTWTITLDALLLEIEAETRWLDLVEARIAEAGDLGGLPTSDIEPLGGDADPLGVDVRVNGTAR